MDVTFGDGHMTTFGDEQGNWGFPPVWDPPVCDPAVCDPPVCDKAITEAVSNTLKDKPVRQYIAD
jgi:hypothetical protein